MQVLSIGGNSSASGNKPTGSTTTSSSTHDKNIITIVDRDNHNQFKGHLDTPISKLPLKSGHEYHTSNGEEIRLHNDKIQQKTENGNWKTINSSAKLSQLPQTGMKKEFILMCTGAGLILISIASGILIFKRKKKKRNQIEKGT